MCNCFVQALQQPIYTALSQPLHVSAQQAELYRQGANQAQSYASMTNGIAQDFHNYYQREAQRMLRETEARFAKR